MPDLLTIRPKKSNARRRIARALITGLLDEAVRAGKVTMHCCGGITRILDRFSPHSLWHAFISALLSRGVPITDVASWLGHRNINVTYAIYGHWRLPYSVARRKC